MPDYAAAWTSIRYNARGADTENTVAPDLALIEPGIRLLELSAAYRAAHAAFEAAPEHEHLEPLRVMSAARDALLAAARGGGGNRAGGTQRPPASSSAPLGIRPAKSQPLRPPPRYPERAD